MSVEDAARGRASLGKFHHVCGVIPDSSVLVREQTELSTLRARSTVRLIDEPFFLIDPLAPDGPQLRVEPRGATLLPERVSSHRSSNANGITTTRSQSTLKGKVFVIGNLHRDNGQLVMRNVKSISEGEPAPVFVDAFGIWFMGLVCHLSALLIAPPKQSVISKTENNQVFRITRQILEDRVEEIVVTVTANNSNDRIQMGDLLIFIKQNVDVSVPPASISMENGSFEVKFLVPKEAEKNPSVWPRLGRFVTRFGGAVLFFSFLDLMTGIPIE